MRMLARFRKSGSARFVSHLDLMRAVQRAIRRSGMPVKYSSGFNPHQLLSFASASSVGLASEAEWMDVTLTEDISEAQFMEAVDAQMPDDLRLIECHAIADNYPALMSITAFADYRVEMKWAKPVTKNEIDELLNLTLEKPIMAMKKGKAGTKEIDLRPFIASWSCEDAKETCDGFIAALRMRLVHAPTGALNPDLLLKSLIELWALDKDYAIASKVRTAMWIEKDGMATDIWSYKA